jgi:hypothetical protein
MIDFFLLVVVVVVVVAVFYVVDEIYVVGDFFQTFIYYLNKKN